MHWHSLQQFCDHHYCSARIVPEMRTRAWGIYKDMLGNPACLMITRRPVETRLPSAQSAAGRSAQLPPALRFCLLLQTTLCGALPEQRITALKDFIHDKTTTVLTVVMSTGGGAAGLTLTVASTVFLLEPNLNIGLETQAAGRVHRLGGLLTVLAGGGVLQMIKCLGGMNTRECKAAAGLAQDAYAMSPSSNGQLCPSWHSA